MTLRCLRRSAVLVLLLGAAAWPGAASAQAIVSGREAAAGAAVFAGALLLDRALDGAVRVTVRLVHRAPSADPPTLAVGPGMVAVRIPIR